MRMIFNKELLNEEQALVFQLRQEEKVLLREIAEQMGLSVKRVQQIECEARRRLEEYGENPREGFVLLPTRVRKMLENLEFGSRSEVLAAVQSGRMYYDEERRWSGGFNVADLEKTGINVARLRNAGRKSWDILLQWLGLQTAEEQEEIAKRKMEELERKRAERLERLRRKAEEVRARKRAKRKFPW